MAVCTSCGKENGASFRFCVACGTALPRRSLTGQTAPPPSLDETAPLELPPVITAPERLTLTGPAKPSRLELLAVAIDGEATGSVPLSEGTTILGRKRGGAFARDRLLSLAHVAVTPEGDRLRVRDAASLNGVFRKLRAGEPVPIEPGQSFRVGQELLRFDALRPRPPDAQGVEHLGSRLDGYVGRLVVVHGRRATGDAFAVPTGGLRIGRERGDVLFPDDGYVSGMHCQLAFDGARVTLTDLGSSNGTFVRISGEVVLPIGEVILVGKQLFRLASAPRT